MAKRKKGSKIRSRAKLQRRTKLRRTISAKRSKGRKVAKAAKQAVAKAKPKRLKKAALKETAAPAVETLVDTSEIPEESEPKPPSLI